MTSRGILNVFFTFAKGIVIGNNRRFQASDLIEIGRLYVRRNDNFAQVMHTTGPRRH